VEAKEIKAIGASTVTGEFDSALFAQADIFLTGTGGNIAIKTDSLLVEDGAQINTSTFGDGDAGNLTIVAKDVELIGASGDDPGGLFAKAEYVGFDGVGQGGELDLTTSNLLVSDGAVITVSSTNLGDAGNLKVTADNIELRGESEFALSGLLATTEFTGNGGDLKIVTGSLLVDDSAQITADTLHSGKGGNLSITADKLAITQGGQVAVSSLGSGEGGLLEINAQEIELDGVSEFGSSGIFSSALEADGDGGDINLNSDRLKIINGATINGGNFPSSNSTLAPGTGRAGSLNLQLGTLVLNSSPNDLSSITASTNTQTGGDINLDVARSATIANGSLITAETQGTGDGGNINFTADRLNLNSGGQVSVNSTGTGNAGNIA
ncbi:MAG: hypothetical protein AAFV28_15225, partial [Cyanobacteria bacterium J06635_13]